jgi:hypothetical protein
MGCGISYNEDKNGNPRLLFEEVGDFFLPPP